MTQHPEFMSRDHVAAMNERLRTAEDVRTACRQLGHPRVMLFRLRNGPDGGDVCWALTYDDTIQFTLDDHPRPDVVLTGEWQAMIRAVRAARDGESESPDLQIDGDAELFAQLNAIFDIARPVATLDTLIPEGQP